MLSRLHLCHVNLSPKKKRRGGSEKNFFRVGSVMRDITLWLLMLGRWWLVSHGSLSRPTPFMLEIYTVALTSRPKMGNGGLWGIDIPVLPQPPVVGGGFQRSTSLGWGVSVSRWRTPSPLVIKRIFLIATPFFFFCRRYADMTKMYPWQRFIYMP